MITGGGVVVIVYVTVVKHISSDVQNTEYRIQTLIVQIIVSYCNMLYVILYLYVWHVCFFSSFFHPQILVRNGSPEKVCNLKFMLFYVIRYNSVKMGKNGKYK